MLEQKIDEMKRGFSLIELLIVIIIISIVYFLGFEGVELGKSTPKALTPLNLKTILIKSNLSSKRVTLLCADKCRSCYLRIGGMSSTFQPYDQKIDLRDIEAYTLDERDSLFLLEYGRFNDKKICLILDFYKNGSSTQLILKDKNSAYFLPAFFDKPQKVDSLDDAKDLWLKNSDLASNSGDFY